MKTILLTTDLSEASAHAVAPTVTLARKFGAKILLTYVGDLFPPMIEEYYVAIDLERLRNETELRAKTALTDYAAKHLPADLVVERVVLLGVPHIEIVRSATEQKADLIVIATHGHGFISHALLGSTTERILRRSPCPVLVVRDPRSKA